jgi:hypothetical protein
MRGGDGDAAVSSDLEPMPEASEFDRRSGWTEGPFRCPTDPGTSQHVERTDGARDTVGVWTCARSDRMDQGRPPVSFKPGATGGRVGRPERRWPERRRYFMRAFESPLVRTGTLEGVHSTATRCPCVEPPRLVTAESFFSDSSRSTRLPGGGSVSAWYMRPPASRPKGVGMGTGARWLWMPVHIRGRCLASPSEEPGKFRRAPRSPRAG